MAMHALQRKAEEARSADSPIQEKSGRPENCPESASIPYDRIREVLAGRQRAWDKRLAEAKCKKAPVVPQVRSYNDCSTYFIPASSCQLCISRYTIAQKPVELR